MSEAFAPVDFDVVAGPLSVGLFFFFLFWRVCDFLLCSVFPLNILIIPSRSLTLSCLAPTDYESLANNLDDEEGDGEVRVALCETGSVSKHGDLCFLSKCQSLWFGANNNFSNNIISINSPRNPHS